MNGTMEKREFTTRFPDLEGARLLVIGLGRSGLAAARLARAQGAHVTISDNRDAGQLATEINAANSIGAEVVCGGQPPTLTQGLDLIIVSPGVPPTIELLTRARRQGIPIWGEIELAGRFCRGTVIGITGSNGKSTVTTMIGQILRHNGVPGGTGGNLDEPFADLLALDRPEAVHAVELSSFQLETTVELRPQVALILNLSPDHLDRYRSFEAYGQAKARLLQSQQPDQFTILNLDDAASAVFSAEVRGRLHHFSTQQEIKQGAFLRDGMLTLRGEWGDDTILATRELPVRGTHNIANALAAALACRLVGCEPAGIAAGLRAYTPLPHRLEHIRTLRGIAFYNDSKATNPESTISALSAFDAGKVHLILGGRDKNADWSSLVPVVRRVATCILLVGEAAPVLRSHFEGTAPLLDCDTIEAAVKQALGSARPGDVILLSPGCASFDQYGSFVERGEAFRGIVEALPDEGGSDA
jgi:UDP-N-acetylmuramoylalanine--D-glutamate ligase